MGGPGSDPLTGVDQSAVDEGALQPVGLTFVAPLLPTPALGQLLLVPLDGLRQLLADWGEAFGHRDLPGEVLDETDQVGESAIVLESEGLECGVRCDAWVAIPVAADP